MTSTSSVMVICSLLVLLLPFVASQAVSSSSDALPLVASPLSVTYASGTAGVAPLTSEAGINQSPTALRDVKISGALKLFNAISSVLSPSDIAYISCDPNGNSLNVSATDVINFAITRRPKAILLYSLVDTHCVILNPFSFKTIFSMTSIQEANNLQSITQASMTSLTATIAVASGSSIPTPGSQSSSDPSSTPTTAVAMSILYSITGIITLLFLVIIVTGAVRAHRHPERYGPRTAFAGRPRQSRAKGLARAMLETLPIVKFGDPEPVKEGNRDVELEEGISEAQSTAEQPVEREPEPNQSKAEAMPESGLGPNIRAQSMTSNGHIGDVDVLGCSICTEDFEKGEDVRVLPCNHKFHPACIDPWLLNVSGTCPLCRVNLAPVDSNTPENIEGQNAETDVLPPPLAAVDAHMDPESPPRGRVARPLDTALLRQASATERIAALRELRQQQRETSNGNADNADDPEEQGRRARLTRRLKDVFRIRTRVETSGGGEA